MTPEQKIRRVAEIDGVELITKCNWCVDGVEGTETGHHKCTVCNGTGNVEPRLKEEKAYLESHDAILPVIAKQHPWLIVSTGQHLGKIIGVSFTSFVKATPEQLTDALIAAVDGK